MAEIYGTFSCTHFNNSKHLCGDGTKQSFMSRDILKDIANEAIKEAVARNKVTKAAKKVSVVVSSNGCSFLDETATPAEYIKIEAMSFHCLVMGKKSGWSKKQMAVLMERDSDCKSLIARVVEFPKKKTAGQMFKSFVDLMTFLKGKYDASKNETGHDDAPDDDNAEYLSILVT